MIRTHQRCSALYKGMSKGRKKYHLDVHSVNFCNCCTILESLSGGIEIDQVSTEIRHPIQSTSTSKAALCHDMGMPRMRKRTTKSEAQSGDEILSSHANKSSTYCHNAWPCARSAWLVRTINPCNAAPVPATGSRPKIQCNATVKLASCMKTQHTAILRVDEDAAMSFGDIQCTPAIC